MVHEPARIDGNFSFPGAVLLHSAREPSFDNVRQFNSCGVYQEPRNPEVSVPSRSVKEAPRVLRSSEYYSNSQAPSREIECFSGPGVVSSSGHTDWTLDQATFNSIWNRNGSFGCDLFATRFNKKLENLDIEGLITNYLMRGIFIYRPPQKTKEMPRWSLDLVFDYLKSDSFEPLESANLTLLTQKALFLILLASGEIANLSRDFIRHDDSSLELVWVPSFLPKHHTPDFQPAYPSISRLNSSRVTDRLLCPVRAYITYLDRSQIWWDRNQDDEHHTCLWTIPSSTIRASPDYLSNLIGALVGESRRFSGEPSVEVGIHQIRKLAASHSIQAGQNEQTIKEKMGFSEVNILRKNYIAQVSNLKVACVLPGGTFIPKRAHDLSESDSD